MRPSIVLDEALLAEARKCSRARTKTALVEEALRAFVESRAEEHRRTTYERRLLALRERVNEGRKRPSSHDIVRSDRERE